MSRIWKPVRRKGADRYMRLNILSFAASVSITRLFLELMGYPQLGNETLHIAHVLYGGVLLYVSSILPLLYANRWAYTWGSLLSGVGVGFFIDEVGKFITQENDYFFPVAAPIIYASFLLTVLLYLRVSRGAVLDARGEFYAVLETLSEVLDHDLEPEEHEDLRIRLARIRQKTDSHELMRLSEELTQFVETEAPQLSVSDPNLFDKIIEYVKSIERLYVTPSRVKIFLIVTLFILGVPSTMRFRAFMEASIDSSQMSLFVSELSAELPPSFHLSRGWVIGYVIADSVMGAALMVAAVLIFMKRDRWGIELGSVGLLAYILGLNLILFYVEQFSSMIIAGIQYLVLQTLYYYQREIGRLGQRIPLAK